MREHPIPQDITGYKFHIIGSMTLKQFVEIAIGVGIAGLLYTTNLPTAIKYPLMLFAAASGGLVAFLPIEERPLDHWIITFIRVMYRPTQFFWKREAHIPEVFNYRQGTIIENQDFEFDLGPVKKERIREYLTTVPNVDDPYSFNFDEIERMNAILGSFSSVQPSSSTPSERKKIKPQLGVRVRNLRPVHQEQVVYAADGTTQIPATQMTRTLTPVASTDSSLEAMYTERQTLAKQQMAAKDVAQEVAIPETELISVADQTAQAALTEPNTAVVDQDSMVFMENQAHASQVAQEATQADFNANLPFPEPPNEPNKLVGMVLSPRNELIVNAVIEILKPDGAVTRAVRSNRLGQFFVTTPLENGDYTVVVKKDGFEFHPIRIQVVGDLIAPLEVRSVS